MDVASYEAGMVCK